MTNTIPSHVHGDNSPVMPVQFQLRVNSAVSRAPSLRKISDAVTMKALRAICSQGLPNRCNRVIPFGWLQEERRPQFRSRSRLHSGIAAEPDRDAWVRGISLHGRRLD